MPKQIITLEVEYYHCTQNEIGNPESWYWESAIDAYYEDEAAHATTRTIRVLQAGPVVPGGNDDAHDEECEWQKEEDDE